MFWSVLIAFYFGGAVVYFLSIIETMKYGGFFKMAKEANMSFIGYWYSLNRMLLHAIAWIWFLPRALSK